MKVNSQKQRRLAYWFFPVALVFLLVLGWVSTVRRANRINSEIREKLLAVAVETASSLNPELVQSLSFSGDDQEQPAFQTIREQFSALTHLFPDIGRVYLAAQQNGAIALGPEVVGAAGPGDTPRRRPGGILLDPPAGLRKAFETRDAVCAAPDTGACGDYVGAFAPMLDPRSGGVMFVVGIDVSCGRWRKFIVASRFPIAMGTIVLVAIMALGMLAVLRRTRLPPEKRRKLRHIETAMVALCGLTLTAGAVFLTVDQENTERRLAFKQMAASSMEVLREEFRTIRHHMQMLSEDYKLHGFSNRAYFRDLTLPMLKHSAAYAFSFIPRVPDERKAEFEDAARRDGLEEFFFFEKNAAGEKTPVSKRPEYFPVYFSEPLAEVIEAMGWDEGSEPVRRAALEKAAASGSPVVAGPVALVHDPGGQGSLLISTPVFETGVNAAGPAGGESRPVAGFIRGIFKMQTLLDVSAARLYWNKTLMNIRIVEMSPPGRPAILASIPAAAANDAGIIGGTRDFFTRRPGASIVYPLMVADRAYGVIACPAPAYYVWPAFQTGLAMGLSGLLLTLVLSVFTGFLRNRQAELELQTVADEAIINEKERVIAREQELMASLLDNIPDHIYFKDRESRFIRINKSQARRFGLDDPAGAAGKTDFDFFTEEHARPAFEDERAIVRTGNPIIGKEEKETWPDGRESWVSTTKMPLRDGKGNIAGTFGVSRVITEQKLAEKALIEARQRLEYVLKTTNTGIDVIDENFNLQYVDPGWQATYGNPAGRKCYEYFMGRDSMCPGCGIPMALETGKIQVTEETLVKENNRIVEVHTIPFVDESGRRMVAEFNIDITARKRAEADRLDMERRLLHSQKLESLGVLAGGIAHDFNNLMMAVLGNLEMAVSGVPAASGAKTNLEDAAAAAKRAAELARQMLAYSGKGHFNIERVNFNSMLEENAHMLKTAVGDNVSFELLPASDLPDIMADAGQAQQVIMNLITNAAEALEGKPGVVSLRSGYGEFDVQYLKQSKLFDKPAPGRFAWLEVADTGCGMDETTLQRLFDPFFTTKFTGRGLGMSAVMGIVKGHKGAIVINSAKGKGTSVRVLFPISEPPPPAAIGSPAAAGVKTGAGGAPAACAALVVDDETPVRNLCAVMLQRLGFKTFTASDGEEGVRVFKEHADKIGLAVIDLAMPKKDGIATLEEMRAIKPDIKALLCSGYSEQEATERLAGKTPAGFLQKPFTLQKLKSEIEQSLKT